MTEQELLNLIADDLVRIVTNDKQFHLITTHPSMCMYDVEKPTLIGHVRCWCVSKARWLSIDPATIYAWETLNHFKRPPLPIN